MSERSIAEVIYTPRSDLLYPRRFVRQMFRDLFASRELAWRLFVRDLSAKYRQSYLGYLWALLPPIATTGAFVFLQSQGLFTVGHTAVPYPAYVMIGMLLWQVFSDAVQSPLKAVTAAKPMLTKVNFPPEAVLIAGLGDVCFGFLIRLVLLCAVLVKYAFIPPWTVLLVPLAVGALVVAGTAVGVLVTPLGMLYQDVAQVLPLATSYLMFLTPVVYPAQGHGLAGWLSRWNPISPLINSGRDWLITGNFNYCEGFILVSGLAFVVLVLAWSVYRIAMPHLIARIGN